MPIKPPLNERKTASVRNCSRISRLVAPSALRIPISLSLDWTLASMLFMMPTPLTTSVMPAPSVSTIVSMSAIFAMLVRSSVRVCAL